MAKWDIPPGWVCDAMEENCHKRFTPTRHQRSHLTPRYKCERTYTSFGSIAHCSQNFLFIYFFLCSVRRGNKKIHLLTEAEHSKFEYLRISENYTFRKTKGPHSKSFGSSPLITVQDLLFQSFSSKSTSQQGGRTHPKQLPLRQCRHEG